MPALFRNDEARKLAMQHLGYPAHFSTLLLCFKVLGALALIIPKVSAKIKEWAYADFTFDFLGAALSYFFVDGLVGFAFSPLVVMAFLAVSYVSYHKLQGTNGLFKIFEDQKRLSEWFRKSFLILPSHIDGSLFSLYSLFRKIFGYVCNNPRKGIWFYQNTFIFSIPAVFGRF